ncbi:MAG: PilW family protein [Candidatus Competibacteraceae bacterium]
MARLSLTNNRYRLQQGLTLVELLVALTLGLLVTATFLQIFSGSKKLYLVQEQSSGIQDNGKFALEWLGKYIRLAGYRDDPTIRKQYTFRLPVTVRSCGSPAITLSSGQVITGRDYIVDVVKGTYNSDCIIFRYQGNIDGSITDCFGTSIDNNGQADNPQTVINVFFLGFDQNINDWALRCDSITLNANGSIGRNWISQAFINNVQDMQILYGVFDNTAGTQVYLPAAQVANWTNVVSVKIALLLRSEDNASITDQNQPYYFPPWNNNQPVTPNDFRLRRVFTTTINLRN